MGPRRSEGYTKGRFLVEDSLLAGSRRVFAPFVGSEASREARGAFSDSPCDRSGASSAALQTYGWSRYRRRRRRSGTVRSSGTRSPNHTAPTTHRNRWCGGGLIALKTGTTGAEKRSGSAKRTNRG